MWVKCQSGTYLNLDATVSLSPVQFGSSYQVKAGNVTLDMGPFATVEDADSAIVNLLANAYNPVYS